MITIAVNVYTVDEALEAVKKIKEQLGDNVEINVNVCI